MKQVCQEFNRLDDAGTTAMQIGVAVQREDLSLSHRFQGGPPRLCCELREFCQRAWQAESTGGNQQDVRIKCQHILPVVVNTVMTCPSEAIFTTRSLDQIRRPVGGQHKGIKPLHADCAGASTGPADLVVNCL